MSVKPSVCIVGAGAAGLTLANSLLGDGCQVTVIEGGLRSSSSFEGTNGAEVVGLPHRGVNAGRFRGWGGSTARWGGQLWAWDASEFAARDYLGLDGWPISFHEVASHTANAFALLGLPRGAITPDEAASLGVRAPGFNANDFTVKFSTWLPWRKRNLGRTVGARVRRFPNFVVHLGGTAVRIQLDITGHRATGVLMRDAAGHVHFLKADYVIVAAGAIETARLLFASDATRSTESSRWPWLGRGFMDHLSVRMARFHPRDQRVFGEMFAPIFARGAQHTPRILLRPGLLEHEGLLGCYGHWEAQSPEGSVFSLVREKLRRLQSEGRLDLSWPEIRSLTSGAADVMALTAGVLVDRRRYFEHGAAIYLRVDTEQFPNPDSRIIPTAVNDTHGLPRVAVDWRVSTLDQRTVTRAASLLAAELERLNLGTFEPLVDAFEPTVPWGDLKGDSFHMMGGTRMARCVEDGVVDTDAKVFGVDNLFVASTSVFPTGGIANPTLMLICLTLRLAHHLRRSYT